MFKKKQKEIVEEKYTPIFPIYLDTMRIKSYPLDKFPCAESLLQFITQRLQAILDCDYPGIIVVETNLRESSDSYVTCKRK